MSEINPDNGHGAADGFPGQDYLADEVTTNPDNGMSVIRQVDEVDMTKIQKNSLYGKFGKNPLTSEAITRFEAIAKECFGEELTPPQLSAIVKISHLIENLDLPDFTEEEQHAIAEFMTKADDVIAKLESHGDTIPPTDVSDMLASFKPSTDHHGFLEQFKAFSVATFDQLEETVLMGLQEAENRILIELAAKVIRLALVHDSEATDKVLALL